MFSSWKTISVNYREACIGFTSFSRNTQNYSFPAVKVTRKAHGKLCVSYSFFFSFFFLFSFNCHFTPWSNLTTQSTCAGAGLRAAVPAAGDSAHTSHWPPGEPMSGRSGFHGRVPDGRSDPWDCTSQPWKGAVWTLPSSSWRRITRDLITTTWWQPSERSPSLNVMVWMPRLARETLKWLLLEMVSAYQGKDHSINALFLTFLLRASVTALCQRQDIGSLAWLSAANLLVLWLGL